MMVVAAHIKTQNNVQNQHINIKSAPTKQLLTVTLFIITGIKKMNDKRKQKWAHPPPEQGWATQ